MRHRVALTITPLLSMLFTTFHLTEDIVYRMSPGGLQNLATFSVILSARGLRSLLRGQPR